MKTGLFKRVLSGFLAVAVTVSSLTSGIAAEEAQQSDAVSYEYEIESTNSFGEMLAERMTSELPTEEESNAGYNINGVTMTDNIATVEYQALQDCTIVVALYDENGYEMLASAYADVSKDENTATVTFAASEVPEYYLVKAYVVDDNMRPKCKEYVTNDYTKAFVTMMSKTVEDFEEEQVLNLDENTDKNFLVYSEKVNVIDYVAEENVVVSADFENNIYKFSNINETISALNPGEIFSYFYGDDQIIITKVVSVEIDGTNAVITGEDVDMQEAFEFIKIDTVSTDPTHVTGSEGEGVTYLGEIQENKTQLYKGNKSADVEASEGADFKYELKAGACSATFKISISGVFRYYYSGDFFDPIEKIDLVISHEYTIDFSISAEFEHTFDVAEILLISAYGVNLVLNFDVEISVSGALTLTVGFTDGEFGISVSRGANREFVFNSINQKPEPTIELKLEVELYIGVVFGPAVNFIDDSIIDLALNFNIGFTFTATIDLLYEEDKTVPEQHDCFYKGFSCIDGEIEFGYSCSVTLKIAGEDIFDSSDYFEPFRKVKLGDFYYSDAYKEFGFGECPYISYRTTIRLKNGINSKIGSAKVYFGEEDTEGVEADNLNIATSYLLPLPEGEKHIIKATAPGYIDLEEEIEVSAETGAAFHEFKMKREPSDVTIKTVKADGTPAAGANVFIGDRNWGYTDENGELLIEETLSLYEEYTFSVHNGAYEYYMEPVNIVLNDITVTFTVEEPEVDFEYLIENSAIVITGYVGENTDVVIPKKIKGYPVTCIGSYAFRNYENLTSVTISDSVTTIGSFAFYGCENLTSIIIPNSVSSIYSQAFYRCVSLTSITIPDSVTNMGEDVFYGCENLVNVTISNCITSIELGTFEYCDSLTSIIIPDSVTNIGISAFANCGNLTNVVIGNSVTRIGNSAFSNCNALTNIIIPSSVTNINMSAFNNCYSLTDICYTGTENQWANISINSFGNSYLKNATIHYNYVPTETVDISYNSHDTMMAETVEVAYLNDTATAETIDVSRAVFSGLMPEKLYNFYVMVDKDAEAPFASTNLLNIQQGTADSAGTLTITYIGDERFDTADIFVVCEDPISIENAVVSEINLEYTGEMQYVDPVVTLDGKVLDSAEDYYITSEYCATNAGTYTYEVVGMGDYGGAVTATFTIAGEDKIAAFVERLYTTMLGRASDPTGKANHVSSLNNGKTAAEVSAKFVTSAELKNKNLSNDEFVLRMYQTFMNRTPSVKEITRWATTLENGCTYEYVLKKFVASAEFKNLCAEYGITAGTYEPANNRDYDENITAFVSRMYTTLLGRSFDASGLNNNAGIIINGGTAADVGKKFVMSGELTNLKLGNDEFVKRMYQTFLNRTPAAKEITRWATTLENGCSYGYILKKFVASAEFNTLCTKYNIKAGEYATTENRDYNENITAYVSRMYTKALGRSFDIKGLNNNTGRLITGEMTAAEVAEYFILSKEFVNRKLTDEQYVTTLYSALFNRAPDAGGKTRWLNKLAAGTSRAEVLKGFTSATEFKNLVKSFGL